MVFTSNKKINNPTHYNGNKEAVKNKNRNRRNTGLSSFSDSTLEEVRPLSSLWLHAYSIINILYGNISNRNSFLVVR